MKIVILGYGKMGHEVEQIALQRGHVVTYRIDSEEDWYATAITNIEKCFEQRIPIVVGTTGWYNHLDDIRKRCEDECQTLFYAPNFSIGMNFVFKLNKEMAKFAQQ